MALTSATVSANTAIRFGYGSVTVPFPFSVTQSFTGGATTSGSADRVYIPAQASITSGAPLTIDLSGSLTQPDGSSCVFIKIVGIYIKNTSALGSGHLTIGGGSNPLAGVTGYAGPLGVFCMTNDNGITVTAGTGDILQIAASTGTVTAQIVIVGRSA